jgi:hypothetical protein
VPSLPLPLVHLVSLRSLLGRLGKTGVGTSHKPRRYFQSGHQHKYRGPGPGPSHPINIPGGSPPTPLRPPALAPGSSLLRVADTFTFFSQEPVSAAAMLRNPRPAAAHHLDCHVITATQCEPSTMGCPLLGPRQTCAGHPGISPVRWLWPLRRGYQHRRGNQSDRDRSQHQHHNIGREHNTLSHRWMPRIER